MSEQVAATSFDSLLDALGHVDRRRLLLALQQATAKDELPVEIEQVVPATTERDVLVSMRHVHLPKLADLGVIETTRADRAVTPGPRFEDVEPVLDMLDANRDRLPADWV